MNTNYYKFGLSEPGNTSSYDLGFSHAYEINGPDPRSGEQRRHLQSASTMTNEQNVAVNSEWEGSVNTSTRHNPRECKLVVLLFSFLLLGWGWMLQVVRSFMIMLCGFLFSVRSVEDW